MKHLALALFVVLALVGLALPAHAALTAPTLDTADFLTIAGAVIVASGVFFGVRKAMRLLS